MKRILVRLQLIIFLCLLGVFSCSDKKDDRSQLKTVVSNTSGTCSGFLYKGVDCQNSLVAGDANQCMRAGCVWFSGGLFSGCNGKVAVDCSFFTSAQACNALSRVCSWSVP